MIFTLPSWYLFAIGLKHEMLVGLRVTPKWRLARHPWAWISLEITTKKRDLEVPKLIVQCLAAKRFLKDEAILLTIGSFLLAVGLSLLT